MKHRVDELEGEMLDAAVAFAEGYGTVIATWGSFERWSVQNRWQPGVSWADAGPIIEREAIGFYPVSDATWEARNYITEERATGDTPLIAAMRCYVRSKFGEFVELPEVAS